MGFAQQNHSHIQTMNQALTRLWICHCCLYNLDNKCLLFMDHTVFKPNRLRHLCDHHCLELYNVVNQTLHPGTPIPLPPKALLCIYSCNKRHALKYADYQRQWIIKVQPNYIPIVLKHSSTFWSPGDNQGYYFQLTAFQPHIHREIWHLS